MMLDLLQSIDNENILSQDINEMSRQYKCRQQRSMGTENTTWDNIRFLRISRYDNKNNYTNILRLNAYSNSQRHDAKSGIATPLYNRNDWQNANNETESDRNYAATRAASDGRIELDFGESGVSCVAFVVVHRENHPERMIGTRFEAIDIYNRVVFSYNFTTDSPRRALFRYPAITPIPLLGNSPLDTPQHPPPAARTPALPIPSAPTPPRGGGGTVISTQYGNVRFLYNVRDSLDRITTDVYHVATSKDEIIEHALVFLANRRSDQQYFGIQNKDEIVFSIPLNEAQITRHGKLGDNAAAKDNKGRPIGEHFVLSVYYVDDNAVKTAAKSGKYTNQTPSVFNKG